MRFVMGAVEFVDAFRRVIRIVFTRRLPPVLHTHVLLIYHRYYIMLANNGIFKQNISPFEGGVSILHAQNI
jgi:hypothetical protein